MAAVHIDLCFNSAFSTSVRRRPAPRRRHSDWCVPCISVAPCRHCGRL